MRAPACAVAAALLIVPGLSLSATPLAAASPSAAPPSAELLTIGNASDLYARFGHAAIRIGDTVYNYGYTNFASPRLMVDFLRARALFWGEREDYAGTLRFYRAADRTVIRQRLNLSPAQFERLQQLLLSIEDRYVYHHFADNCATRIRDVLDQALGGKIAGSLMRRPPPLRRGIEAPLTVRKLVRHGFADRLDLLLTIAFFLGRSADRPLDSWQAGFLPELLAESLGSVVVGQEKLLGTPRVVYQRRYPPPGQGAKGEGAIALLWWLCAALLLLGLGAVLLTRSRRRSGALILLLFALLSTALALPLWLLAALSSLPELAKNEWALLFWPTDIVLFGFATSLLRGRFWRRRWIDRYLALRLVGLSLFALATLVGLLYQRPLVILGVATILALSPYTVMRILPPAQLMTSE